MKTGSSSQRMRCRICWQIGLIFSLSCITFPILAFSNKDSLIQVLGKTRTSEERIKVLLALESYQVLKEPDTIKYKHWHQQILRLSKNNGDQQQIAESWYNYGKLWSNVGNFQTAVEAFMKALALYRIAKDKHGEVFALFQLVRNHFILRNFKQSNYWGRLALALPKSQQLLAPLETHLIYFFLGQNYSINRQQDSSLYFFFKARAFRLKHYPQGSPYELNPLSYQLFSEGNYSKAIHYCYESVRINQQIEDHYTLIHAYFNLGLIYKEILDTSKQQKILKKALALSQLNNFTNEALYAQAELLMSQRKSYSVKRYQAQLEQILDSILHHNPYQTAHIYYELGDVLEQQGLNKAALEAYTQGVALAKKGGQLDLELQNQINRAKVWANMGNLKLGKAILDSLRVQYQAIRESGIESKYLETLGDIKLKLHENDAYALTKKAWRIQDSLSKEKIRVLKYSTQLLTKRDDQLRSLKIEHLVLKQKIIIRLYIIISILFSLLSIIVIQHFRIRQVRLKRQTSLTMSAISNQLIQIIPLLLQDDKIIIEPTQLSESTNDPFNFKRVNQLTQQVNTLVHEFKDSLQQKAEDLKSFNYTVGHDLKAPLRNAQIIYKLVEERLMAHSDQATANYFKELEQLLGEMQTMIDGINKLVEVDALVLKKITIDGNDLIRRVESLVKNVHNCVSIDFKTEELPKLYGDPLLLSQVFSNLITNAIKSVENTKEPEIKIFGNIIEKYVEISVQDNGIGIPQENLSEIFKLFKSGHTQEEYKGSGIGLAIVTRIVERHGGEIWAESEGKGKGAKFVVKLPRNQ